MLFMNEDILNDKKRYLKYILVGDPGVGKSAIAQRFITDTFPMLYKQTVGVDFFKSQIFLSGDLTAEIELWDISGLALNSQLAKNYLYATNVVLLVYDVTDYASFQHLDEWYKMIQQICKLNMPKIVIIGNKADLSHARSVRQEEHLKFANECGATAYLVSAKTKESIQSPFTLTSAEYLGLDSKRADDTANAVLKAMVAIPTNTDPRRNIVVAKELIDQDEKAQKACITM